MSKNFVYLFVFVVCVNTVPDTQAQDDSGHLNSVAEFSPTQTIVFVRYALLNSFDTLLQDCDGYRITVEAECIIFPEGKIYPYALPALAYANLAFLNPEARKHVREQMVKLIDLAMPQVIHEVHPPQGDLMKMKSYQGHATYLGTLNLVLGTFHLATGDTRYAELNRHISRLLQAALREKKGFPIKSYPHYSWNFDTILALSSLDVYDRIYKTNISKALIEAHLDWIKEYGTHGATGLPYSIGWNGSDSARPPRGCDLSMRICLMAQFAPKDAEALYAQYVASHWIELGVLAGFSEWPSGSTSHDQDIDAGPVFMGVGATASSMGLGTTIAAGDAVREQRLSQQLLLAQSIISLIVNGGLQEPISKSASSWFNCFDVTPSPRYVTSFLYGDAALFYAVTWTEYPERPLDGLRSSEKHKK